jgi:hypothetical protein
LFVGERSCSAAQAIEDDRPDFTKAIVSRYSKRVPVLSQDAIGQEDRQSAHSATFLQFERRCRE